MPEDFDDPNTIIEKIIEKTGKSISDVETYGWVKCTLYVYKEDVVGSNPGL